MNELKWVLSHIGNIVLGLLTALIGYMAPISGVLSVMVSAIILDLVVGLIAARKRGEAIRSKGLWTTVKKLFYSVVVVAVLFAIDTEMKMIELHRFVAWLIAGFEIWSILENAAFITEHPVFNIIQKYMQDKIKDSTGIDISENHEDTKES